MARDDLEEGTSHLPVQAGVLGAGERPSHPWAVVRLRTRRVSAETQALRPGPRPRSSGPSGSPPSLLTPEPEAVS